AGVYFGSANGRLYYTRDAGNSWQTLADNLPPVYSVSVAEE
ncbi:MAG: exo-alpha-sialidase, partial [Acidobacteria bacterium]|nr:exo-alpha-sialidase [Acidobacteriota bacterium]